MRPLLRHQNYYKKHLHFFFTKYNNDRKEHNFRRKKSQKKVIFTKTKKYLREMTLIMKKN